MIPIALLISKLSQAPDNGVKRVIHVLSVECPAEIEIEATFEGRRYRPISLSPICSRITTAMRDLEDTPNSTIRSALELCESLAQSPSVSPPDWLQMDLRASARSLRIRLPRLEPGLHVVYESPMYSLYKSFGILNRLLFSAPSAVPLGQRLWPDIKGSEDTLKRVWHPEYPFMISPLGNVLIAGKLEWVFGPYAELREFDYYARYPRRHFRPDPDSACADE